METPQQQEIERSGRGEVDPQGRRAAREAKDAKQKGVAGKVPPDNRPGHRPQKEQDKPHPAP